MLLKEKGKRGIKYYLRINYLKQIAMNWYACNTKPMKQLFSNLTLILFIFLLSNKCFSQEIAYDQMGNSRVVKPCVGNMMLLGAVPMNMIDPVLLKYNYRSSVDNDCITYSVSVSNSIYQFIAICKNQNLIIITCSDFDLSIANSFKNAMKKYFVKINTEGIFKGWFYDMPSEKSSPGEYIFVVNSDMSKSPYETTLIMNFKME